MLLRCVQAAGSASTIALGEVRRLVGVYYILTSPSGAGVIGDISTAEERGTDAFRVTNFRLNLMCMIVGGFFGLYGVGPMVCHSQPDIFPYANMLQLGPSIGPIIGGGLAQSLGWR